MSQNLAVCIGINRYDNLKPLDYARQDAEAVSSFFSKEAGFKDVYFLAEDAPPLKSDYGQPLQSRPTFGNLMRFLRVRFEQPFMEPSDNLWFFFAGHGRRERDQDYLLPLDADPGNVEETGIPVRYVAERLRKSGAENVILLLDACRNEGARDGQGVGLERQKGTVTVSSCSPAEFSYEISDLGHGAFTYGLLEGLKLHGEQNCATVERLDGYLQTRVPEICRMHGKPRQTPCTFAEPLSKRHFILLPSAALPEDLEPLKIEALQAEAIGDLALAEQLWWRINAVSPTDAQSREAIRRIAAKLERIAEHERHKKIEGDELDGGDEPLPEGHEDEDGDKKPTKPEKEGGAAEQGKEEEKHENKELGWRFSRRKVFAGIAATALLGNTGFYIYSRFMKSALPAVRTEMVSVQSVDTLGASLPADWQEVSYFTQYIDDRNAIDFSMVPAGEFSMGSPMGEDLRRDNEGPVFMRLRQFAMSRTAITQAQWRALVVAQPQAKRWALPIDPSSFKGDELPVETINWQQAWEFCARLSALTGLVCRLPSQAEWEYACRARTTTPFHFGPTLTSDLANYCGTGGAVCGTSFGKDVASLEYDGIAYENGSYALGPEGVFNGSTKPVRTYPQNRFGMFEMHGNVWEHCLDNWTARLADIPGDGSAYVGGRPDLHVLRGGSWSHNPAICRSAYRESISETNRGWEGRIGLRVVCEV
ncbi:SUMF1/EgtB/PvdO family nonheme iron enzyme [Rhizobium sp. BK251]|uniref:SUMF1/EgtB/PvdO family nonheme iron enzyme n=1 Tax=Rhizobium sp. BK251 TaxID=2512125 RepID=UPI0010473C42|nr:SUMF1/EgtB/PvdO family nonheme iron enzyme [Rhizobium sp. BK251]TCL74656.1 formylglycine-generating enzyme required for sulfatase activity [Rhizobium sp. BK251]